MKTFVSAKIHGVYVTDRNVDYNGSVGICAELMAQAGIDPYEQVHLVNLRNGERWVTYAIPAERGAFVLNGGSARLGEVGDRCLAIAYRLSDHPFEAAVLFCDRDNRVASTGTYDVVPTL
ncbi:MAG: aspartate 1-decarboxylase [Cyanobacteria bacterium]|nr:aspartate 1-decarboxylase [Cyanobacteriota bacterium]